ncbi:MULTISPECIES: PIN domain-containing protein [unclassified Aeromicrobium]|uniref:PIN domain-containing protein n=1 Tax=unclassified Aeromicrobium TaxID=2633570 RepID=UPI00288AC31B|nr:MULTISPECIES: PIN domain-containing protein [unclassified Aeromicrobium]
MDTNALRGGGYGPAPSATLLRGLAWETGHRLSLPQEVVDERLASFEREVAPLIGAGDVGRLLDIVPSWHGRAAAARDFEDAPLPSVASAKAAHYQSLTERPSTRFLILPTPPRAADEGVSREKSRRRPATQSGHEARDVVVWLTALEAAKSQRQSNVYFVSADKTYCGDRADRLHPDLAAEAPRNLRFFRSVDALINRLSCPAVPRDGLADSPEVIAAIEQTALYGDSDPNHDLRRDLWDWAPDGVSFSRIASARPALVKERGIRSRRCGSTMFTAIDAVYRLDLEYNEEGAGTTAVTVRLGVLVTEDEGDPLGVRVLARAGIKAHGSEEDLEATHGTE